MSVPQTESEGESESSETETTEQQVEMVETTMEETGTDPDGIFDGVDVEDSGDDVSGMFDGTEDPSDPDTEPQTTKTSGLADDINSGVARAAVIGLDDEWETDSGETKQKDDLESEFKETFEAFRLGHYAEECAKEYLQLEEDIHPVWGLIGASLICSAVIVYKRPDGDELVDSAKTNLGEFQLPSVPTGDEDA
jgi:hypothetical protein